MKTTLNLVLLLFVLIFNTACPKSETKPELSFNGTWTGVLSPLTNLSKSLSLKITSGTNPVSGTYTLGTTTSDVLGDVSGSALGLIYSLTLKPKTRGITYTISGTWAMSLN